MEEYKLRCALPAYEARSLLLLRDDDLACCFVDKIKVWSEDPSDRKNLICSKTLIGGSSFVGPLAWNPPQNDGSDGGKLVSIDINNNLEIWDLGTGMVIEKLKHRSSVAGVTLDGTEIISASDGFLRRWSWSGEELQAWEAHESDVKAVLKLPCGVLVSGSDEGTIKLWKRDAGGFSHTRTCSEHEDVVACLAVFPGAKFVSASHDSSIKLWNNTGDMLLEMVGHTSHVLSIHANSSGLIVSGSGDGRAKIWKDGQCIQSLNHPGKVIDVKLMESGDLATACSDGIVRLWTSSPVSVAANTSSAGKVELVINLVTQLLTVEKEITLLEQGEVDFTASIRLLKDGCENLRGRILEVIEGKTKSKKKTTQENFVWTPDMASEFDQVVDSMPEAAVTGANVLCKLIGKHPTMKLKHVDYRIAKWKKKEKEKNQGETRQQEQETGE